MGRVIADRETRRHREGNLIRFERSQNLIRQVGQFETAIDMRLAHPEGQRDGGHRNAIRRHRPILADFIRRVQAFAQVVLRGRPRFGHHLVAGHLDRDMMEPIILLQKSQCAQTTTTCHDTNTAIQSSQASKVLDQALFADVLRQTGNCTFINHRPAIEVRNREIANRQPFD